MKHLFFDDTIVAPATIPGTGAITVIRVSGPDTYRILAEIILFKNVNEAKGYSIKYGSVVDKDNKVIDEVLVGCFRSPCSYTGEDMAEISCHASSYISSRIVELVCSCGARVALPGEFTRRAFVNGKMDLAQAESVADLIASSSEIQHRVAMNQLKGGYSRELSQIRSSLLELAALLELELDFSEEDVEFADRQKLESLLAKASEKCENLADSFRVGNAIKKGVPVAIIGAPNSGKSTLLNALLREERAIVSDVPGTTRDTIEETCVLEGILFRFIDTAGIRQADEVVEKMGIERAIKFAKEADIVIGVIDGATSGINAIDGLREKVRDIVDIIDISRQKIVVLINKIDCVEIKNEAEEGAVNYMYINGIAVPTMAISAINGYGLKALEGYLPSLFSDQISSNADSVLVTNARHYTALREAANCLSSAQESLTTLSPDLVAEDLRSAISALGSITGEISTNEVLGEIFEKFCIGK